MEASFLHDCVAFLFKRERSKVRRRVTSGTGEDIHGFVRPYDSVTQAAVCIQSAWRGTATRQWVRSHHEMLYILSVQDRIRANSYNFRILWNPSELSQCADESPLTQTPDETTSVESGGVAISKLRTLLCSICLQRSTTLESCCQIETRCGHRFHYNCMVGYMDWCIAHNVRLQCPYCRTSIHLHSPVLRFFQRCSMKGQTLFSGCCGSLALFRVFFCCPSLQWDDVAASIIYDRPQDNAE